MDDITKPMDMEKYYKKVVAYLIEHPLSTDISVKVATKLAIERPDLFLESIEGNLDDNIIEFLKQGLKIRAIKWYRSETGEGLKEAKDYVEHIQYQNGL